MNTASEISGSQAVAQGTKSGLSGWLPMGVGLAVALCLGPFLPPWGWMWALAVAIFGGFKWVTLTQALNGGVRPVAAWRAPAYLLLWPGMDALGFLTGAAPVPPSARAWGWAGVKTLLGAGLLWGVVRFAGGGLLAGWVGMVGLIFVLHFGSFDLLARLAANGGRCPAADARAGALGVAGRVLGAALELRVS